VAVAVSVVVSLTPWAQFLLYPFKLFTTRVHECGHALMTVLVGGRVTSITIEPDTSGRLRRLPSGERPNHQVSGRGSAWSSTRFGTEGSEVQILSPRPNNPKNIREFIRPWSVVTGRDRWVLGSNLYAVCMLIGRRSALKG
jgi:hypothetical protein